jgi:DNA mismatch repair protein MutL
MTNGIMKKIHVLPERVVSHIAAGEVIERPCYAVKELVENAIDAGADSIHIEIEESGLQKIVVTDNGEGMDPEDLSISFKPHTTSKIKSEHDLSSVKTLGFRGEALASIAAISTMNIKSRDENHPSGFSISLKHGEIIDSNPVGMPVGTSVTVEHLFSPVPARKKFLKSARTEFRLIVEIVSRLALAHPHIHFFLSHNGRQVFDFPKDQSYTERASVVFGPSFFQHLIPVHAEDSYVKISGFISKPQLTTKSGAKHFLVVNNRHIVDDTVSKAVKEAYGTLLDPHSYPVYLLYISIPHEVVDVNIHPRKEKVGFTDKTFLNESLVKSVSETLSNNNLLFQQMLHDADKRSTQTFTGLLLKDVVEPWNVRDAGAVVGNSVTQIHNLYIIAPTKRGILCVDQHAAHERILYEQFKNAFGQKQKEQKKYPLRKSIAIDLTLPEAELLAEHMPLFEEMGFVIEVFKDSTFVLREVPLLFQDRDYKSLIVEILENLAEEHGARNVDSFSEKILKYLACRAGIGGRCHSGTCPHPHDLVPQIRMGASRQTAQVGRLDN